MATQVTTGLLANNAVTDAKLHADFTATTQSASDNSTSVATTAYVTTAIANLADSAPDTLNTLNELAAALGDDANFSTTVTNSIATKLPLAGGTLTGALTTNGVINTGTSHNFAINTPNSLRINIDSNNSATDQIFVIGHNQTAVDNNNSLLTILESGNVGIGTSNPDTELTIVGGIKVSQSDIVADSITMSVNTSSSYAQTITLDDIGLTFDNNSGSRGYRFGNNGSERMRIDSSGELFLNTTSAMDNCFVSLQDHSNGEAFLGLSAKDDNNVGIRFGVGTDRKWVNFRDTSNNLIWYSNAAGAERMRIDNSGNVGIGTTPTAVGNYKVLQVRGGSTSNGGLIRLETSDGTSGVARLYAGSTSTVLESNSNTNLVFQTNATERMRIDSSGNIGMGGETNPQHKLSVELNSGQIAMFGGQGTNNVGAYCGIGLGQVLNNNTTYQKISLFAEGTGSGYYRQNFHIAVDTAQDSGTAVVADSKLKIDGSSGVCTIGSTSGISDYYVLRVQTTNGYGRQGSHNGTYYHHDTDRSYFYWNQAGYFNGGAHTYSDESLKKDITLIPNALDSVAKMNGVTFNWKDPENRGGKETGKGKQFGVIAQNMLEVDPELPTLSVDPLADAGNEETDDKLYSMDYARLSPYFIEAIKELKEKLEAAEARITELEG